MEVTYLTSAAILVEDDELSLLCDPWLVDGAYYGSWCHYPPPRFQPEDFDDVDYIYISHIHPDHFDERTLRRMDTDIPVLIHDYRFDYLADSIGALGFDVIELPHAEAMELGGDWHIRILAANACDPELCGNFFGCDWFDESGTESGSTQVDSMAVIDNGEYTVVDTNDCPYPMAERSCRWIKNEYGHVDLVCHQYGAAQFYPQCMLDYTHEEKLRAKRAVIEEKLELALNFVALFEPDYYLPFAGEYVLAGDLAPLNEYTANPPRVDAYDYLTEQVDPADHRCVFLNSGEHLDLETGEVSQDFRPVDRAAQQRYIDQFLAERTFDYEHDPMPSVETICSYLPEAYENLERKRHEIGFTSDTDVLVPIDSETSLRIMFDGEGFEYLSRPARSTVDGYVEFSLDQRLLRRLLEGPENAHWGDAKIGSHLGIRKDPDIYERGLYYCMGSFHA